MLEAILDGAIGQAFIDMPTTYDGISVTGVAYLANCGHYCYGGK